MPRPKNKSYIIIIESDYSKALYKFKTKMRLRFDERFGIERLDKDLVKFHFVTTMSETTLLALKLSVPCVVIEGTANDITVYTTAFI